jgi:ElaA protein
VPEVHVARLAELSPATLYGILRLRSDVFVVEQSCAYDDIDGRDLEPSTLQLWMEDDDGAVITTLRILEDGETRSIGRVATRADERHRGLSSALIRRAIELAPPPIVLKAQEYLRDWYASFGFVVCGESWVEDGIRHVPMRLDGRSL